MEAEGDSPDSSVWEHRRFAELCSEKAQGPGVSGMFYDPNGNVAILRTTDISADGTIDLAHMARARVDLERLRGHILKVGDLVITRSGRVGTAALFEGFEIPVIPAGYSTRFRLNESADPRFYRYFFNSHVGQHALKSRAVGSVQQNLAGTAILDMEVPVPAFPEQRAIAHILGSLDDKIELNHRMNHTLEEICRALFKFWFVDFGPVRSKAEGRWKRGESLPGMPANMWDLWPSEFEESEIGEIPKGWKVDSFYEVADVTYGAPYASDIFNTRGDGSPLIRIRDLRTNAPEVSTSEKHPREVRVEPGGLVVGMDGEFLICQWLGRAAVLNQRLCKFAPRGDVPTAFVWFSAQPLLRAFEDSKVGTTVIHLGKSDIDTFRMLVPPSEVLDAFARGTRLLMAYRVANAEHCRLLVTLRDALLPKLLSGEIRVAVDGGE